MIVEDNVEEESGIKCDLDVLCLAGKWAMPPRVRLYKGRGGKKFIAFYT